MRTGNVCAYLEENNLIYSAEEKGDLKHHIIGTAETC